METVVISNGSDSFRVYCGRTEIDLVMNMIQRSVSVAKQIYVQIMLLVTEDYLTN
jgi:hypothetical protein